MAGRKSAYNEQILPFLEQIEQWVADGLTHEDIAFNLHIDPSTLYKYKKQKPELRMALLKRRDEADYRLMSATYEAGYDKIVTLNEYEYDEEGNRIPVRARDHFVRGDQQARKYWLNNRMGDVFADKQQLEVTQTEYLIEYDFDFDQEEKVEGEKDD